MAFAVIKTIIITMRTERIIDIMFAIKLGTTINQNYPHEWVFAV